MASGAGWGGGFLGQEVRRYCLVSDGASCQPVAARRYDPLSGSVNAIGEVEARTHVYRLRSFSPLGRAVFSELDHEYAAERTLAASRAEGTGFE